MFWTGFIYVCPNGIDWKTPQLITLFEPLLLCGVSQTNHVLIVFTLFWARSIVLGLLCSFKVLLKSDFLSHECCKCFRLSGIPEGKHLEQHGRSSLEPFVLSCGIRSWWHLLWQCASHLCTTNPSLHAWNLVSPLHPLLLMDYLLFES